MQKLYGLMFAYKRGNEDKNQKTPHGANRNEPHGNADVRTDRKQDRCNGKVNDAHPKQKFVLDFRLIGLAV